MWALRLIRCGQGETNLSGANLSVGRAPALKVGQGWYPLGGRGHTAKLLADPELKAIAAAHDVSVAQVILRWNLQRGVVVIPGSANPVHIKENLDLFDFELSAEEMARIAALNRDEKHDWY